MGFRPRNPRKSLGSCFASMVHAKVSSKDVSEGSLTLLTQCIEDENVSMASSKKNSEACDEGPGICALALTVVSLVLIVASLPLSLICIVKVVQEYERAVIFRLGRLLAGGARGPGVFFVIPCVDI